jgi:hypothetical protein
VVGVTRAIPVTPESMGQGGRTDQAAKVYIAGNDCKTAGYVNAGTPLSHTRQAHGTLSTFSGVTL